MRGGRRRAAGGKAAGLRGGATASPERIRWTARAGWISLEPGEPDDLPRSDTDMPLRRTIVVLLFGLAGAACDRRAVGCVETGGTILSQLCCKSASELPNTCAAGACGCSPEDSAPLDVCDCPPGRCFDGSSCVSR